MTRVKRIKSSASLRSSTPNNCFAVYQKEFTLLLISVVIDNAPAKEYVAANPGLKVLDTSYAEEDYAIGLAKGSALEDAINAALEELKADGTLQSIVDKYITAE